MAISTFSPQTVAQLAAIAATGFASQPGVAPANTDEGSTLGAIFDAAALDASFIQNELAYTNSILRLSSIVALPGGLPNPDVDAFCDPFGVPRLGGNYATGAVTASTPSPVSSQIVVPVGVIFQTESGTQFIVIADSSNAFYSSTLGGYPINIGGTFVNVTVQCLAQGIIGNVAAGSINQIYGTSTSPIPPAINTVSNAADFVNGVNIEADQPYKSRFTITQSSGRAGTQNSIVAVVLAIQAGLIYSFGDMVNADLSAHPAYFTFVVNEGLTGVGPSAALISAANAAINSINGRAAGVSFGTAIGPSLVPVNGVGTIVPVAGYSSAVVGPAVAAQYAAFINAIGLNVDTTPTTCSLARCYAALLQTQVNGVSVVFDVTGLTLNGVSGDLTAAFANQFVAGTAAFTVT